MPSLNQSDMKNSRQGMETRFITFSAYEKAMSDMKNFIQRMDIPRLAIREGILPSDREDL